MLHPGWSQEELPQDFVEVVTELLSTDQQQTRGTAAAAHAAAEA